MKWTLKSWIFGGLFFWATIGTASGSNEFVFTRSLGAGGGLGSESVELLCIGTSTQDFPGTECRIAKTKGEREIKSVTISPSDAQGLLKKAEADIRDFAAHVKGSPAAGTLHISIENRGYTNSLNIALPDPATSKEEHAQRSLFSTRMLSLEHQLKTRLSK